eukprot:scaffold320178_cov35-Attheya_sp.AAC.1
METTRPMLCIVMIGAWDNQNNSLELISSVTFVVGHNSILCLYIGTKIQCRRRGFIHRILTSIIEYAKKVFKWVHPLLLYQDYDAQSELDSLPVPEDGVTCCAGALCSSPTKSLFNHCACIYCQKNCHEECCYQRVNDDLVIPVNLQDSQRPKDLYTVCNACEKAKLNGTQCAHYYLSVNGTTVSLDPRKTCTRSRVGIYPTHKCCYCNKVVHPKCSTYIPKSFVMSCINGFTQ